jgi:hypothetical protein
MATTSSDHTDSNGRFNAASPTSKALVSLHGPVQAQTNAAPAHTTNKEVSERQRCTPSF